MIVARQWHPVGGIRTDGGRHKGRWDLLIKLGTKFELYAISVEHGSVCLGTIEKESEYTILG